MKRSMQVYEILNMDKINIRAIIKYFIIKVINTTAIKLNEFPSSLSEVENRAVELNRSDGQQPLKLKISVMQYALTINTSATPLPHAHTQKNAIKHKLNTFLLEIVWYSSKIIERF